MGFWRSVGYNTALNARNRRVREAQDEEYEAIPASEITAGDHLLIPEYPTPDSALPLKVRSHDQLASRVPGLGLLRFGASNSKLIRVTAEFGAGEVEAIEVPSALWVLKRRGSFVDGTQ